MWKWSLNNITVSRFFYDIYYHVKMWNCHVITWYCALFFFFESGSNVLPLVSSVEQLKWIASDDSGDILVHTMTLQHTDHVLCHCCPRLPHTSSPGQIPRPRPAPPTTNHGPWTETWCVWRDRKRFSTRVQGSLCCSPCETWKDKTCDGRRSRDRHGEGVKGQSSMRTIMASSLKYDWKERRKISFNF